MRNRTREIRTFLLDHVQDHPGELAQVAAAHFGMSRQAINRHLRELAEAGELQPSGSTRARRVDRVWPTIIFPITEGLAEDTIWRERIKDAFGEISPNVMDILRYGFTAMFNNAIDHSGSANIVVQVCCASSWVELKISDTGVGIFHKIQTELGLEDKRHAVLELSKGKLTTDADAHTGEGIFFTSRMFDQFQILSGQLFLSCSNTEAWLIEDREDKDEQPGTHVFMRISLDSTRTLAGVFDQYTSGDDLGFTRTHVPIRIAQYEGEKLVSRSQAKRILARFDRFKEILLDFSGVESIGHSFADEIFRVFRLQHPEIEIFHVCTTPEVRRAIERAAPPSTSVQE